MTNRNRRWAALNVGCVLARTRGAEQPKPTSACVQARTLRMASALSLVAVLCLTSLANAQAAKDSAKGKPAAAAKEPDARPADKLSTQERRIAEKYKHLEDVLLRMAELNAASDPKRAALLKKAVAQSKDQLIGVRFERLIDLLGKDQLSRALENQTDLDQDLRAILELLMSENRAKSIESEKARLREYLKQLGVLIKQERDLQGRTAGGDDQKRLAGEQGKVAEKTGGLAKDIQKNEEKSDAKAESGKGDGAKGEQGKRESGKDKESKDKGGKGQSGKGQSGDAESGKGENDKDKDQQKDSSQNPARKRLEAAQQRMKEAEKKLEETKRQDATEKQEQALRELEQAKADLEEILRQLREEEIERLLAILEARFRKMLQMQEEVHEGTLRLDKIPTAERTHNQEIEASRLSGKESQIVVEVDKAAMLLHEDGSAVAFPEAVEQMRDDMQQVVSRLAQANVGKITQGIEEDIIAALKDMIAALKKAQKDQENKKKKHNDSQSGQPQDPPLIDLLAELRMIRALQMRVNTRTARYSKLVDGEQAENAELVEALRRLAEREERIHRVTRDLQLGRNQ
jgi:hypothetical protein